VTVSVDAGASAAEEYKTGSSQELIEYVTVTTINVDEDAVAEDSTKP
jgi:hypothetical protein